MKKLISVLVVLLAMSFGSAFGDAHQADGVLEEYSCTNSEGCWFRYEGEGIRASLRVLENNSPRVDEIRTTSVAPCTSWSNRAGDQQFEKGFYECRFRCPLGESHDSHYCFVCNLQFCAKSRDERTTVETHWEVCGTGIQGASSTRDEEDTSACVELDDASDTVEMDGSGWYWPGFVDIADKNAPYEAPYWAREGDEVCAVEPDCHQ